MWSEIFHRFQPSRWSTEHMVGWVLVYRGILPKWFNQFSVKWTNKAWDNLCIYSVNMKSFVVDIHIEHSWPPRNACLQQTRILPNQIPTNSFWRPPLSGVFRRFLRGNFQSCSSEVVGTNRGGIVKGVPLAALENGRGKNRRHTQKTHTPLELNGDAHIKGDISIRLMDWTETRGKLEWTLR